MQQRTAVLRQFFAGRSPHQYEQKDMSVGAGMEMFMESMEKFPHCALKFIIHNTSFSNWKESEEIVE